MAISKEIDLLQHYIDLEKLRYGDCLELDFSYSMDASQVFIAPLILISMVENAFKHGVSSAMTSSVIKIDLQVKEGVLNFKVFNTKAKKKQKDEMKYKKGIGVKNIQRQLELIYPNQYQWEVKETDETYTAKLRLTL